MRQLINLGRLASKQRILFNRTPLQIKNRFSSHYVGYRELNYEPGRVHQKLLAEFLAGVMYWWIGWHFMTDWRHLIGEFILPQRSEWTDEELGIPQD
ncbi:NADH dehydrogenase [ubiquinone] 1 beta subcomplex subunit 2, mitochondrial [Blomia tropicalis]|nr:NADH dehydrogenase [ubiquinone] 1 beta subcomplex subunit 2, mitochondrial [Blomia tropicalis]